MKVFVSDKARSDLLQWYAYLVERNPSAARAAVEAINVRFPTSRIFHLSVGNDQPLAPA